MKKATKVKHRSTYRWDDKYYVDVYELVKQGYKYSRIAKILGIAISTFKNWIEEKPALKAAIKRAKESKTSIAHADNFMEYVYNRLPENLQALWDELQEYDQETNSTRKVELLLSDKGERIRQQLFIHALVTSNFSASEACRRVNITKKRMENWIALDPEFGELMNEVVGYKKDFFESGLVGLVKQGDTAATIFANRTLNQDRGYGTKTEVIHSGGVLHGNVNLDDLDIPVEVKRQLLEAARVKLAPKERTVDIPLLTEMVDED